MTSSSSVDISLSRGEMVILGTQYAGEMKKGVFTVMHYLMPLRGVLSLHSGCNVGKAGDVSLFFGLSGAQHTHTHSHTHVWARRVTCHSSFACRVRNTSTHSHTRGQGG